MEVFQRHGEPTLTIRGETIRVDEDHSQADFQNSVFRDGENSSVYIMAKPSAWTKISRELISRNNVFEEGENGSVRNVEIIRVDED